ncbi:MAG: nicotinate (nicotinamide) nucleotide adenylyltransferase [Bacteroidales bacterium]|jgi:nicotinate-nucleotide adenylyltransferase|nr:nicotinate (nicotinamide) nucleotide adenylyltransferase [Bacteroidales bacterium]
MNIGLYFGSFNPIHIGHLAIANYLVEYSDLDEIWLIVSPQNPLKKKSSLLNEFDRFEMVELAVKDDLRIKPNDIEFNLPKPSYTIDTLTYLSEKNPKLNFNLIVGADSLQSFHKWKNYEEILKQYKLYVYPRPNCDLNVFKDHKNVCLINAPLIEVSSSFIREAIKKKKDIRYFLPAEVYKHIDKMNFYRN